MTITLNLSVAAYSLLIIYTQASYQDKRFRKQKTINHWSKATIYGLLVALLTAILMWGHWHEWRTHKVWIDAPLLGIITRLAWFDLILNYKRGAKWFYNGTHLQGHKGSIMDEWENELSIGAVKALKIAYVIMFIIAVIFLR